MESEIMRVFLCVTFTLFYLHLPPAKAQEPTTNFFIGLVENAKQEERDVFLTLLYGVGQGLVTYDGWNRMNGQERAFCPPDNMLIVHEQYYHMLKQKVNETPSYGKKPFQITLLSALEGIFPCQ